LVDIVGVMVEADGGKYEGEWRKDKKDGNGIYLSLTYRSHDYFQW
jgi:hypothetical protein